MPLQQLVTKVIGSRFQRELKKLRPLIAAIHEHEQRLKALTDAEVQAQTVKFRGVLKDRTGELQAEVDRLRAAKHACADPDERDTLDRELLEAERELQKAIAKCLEELLPEAFATVREACRRLVGTKVSVTGHDLSWDMVPYDVQLIGGIVLHSGRIAEMATGEGKTLVATLPIYLNALPGTGVHLVTVNNYLARRDSQWMGHLYKWLGLTVGCLDDTEPGSPDRRAAYGCDVTYGTNNEYGFDYLRDNMVFNLAQRVQRTHVFAIIDEVDSILIDEARTPLIISGPVGDEENTKYAEFNQQVASLARRQNESANLIMAEAEKLWEAGQQEESAIKAYQVRLGMPKHKRLLRYLNEQGAKKLVQKVELDHLADKKLPQNQQRFKDIEDQLYFVLDEKGHSVHLTDLGTESLSPKDRDLFIVPDLSLEIGKIEKDDELDAHTKAERRLTLESEYAAKSEKLNIVHQLLKAHALYEKDVEYVVQDGQVFIVDEFTGRILAGRRWSDGLHQAVEAKEGVQVKGETQTLATITIQNYFRMYQKLAGMTGTAETEEEEFFKIYTLEVSVIPTNRPIRRLDKQDRIFRTRREKYNAIADEIARMHEVGRPVLVGTVSVEVSETLSRMLKRRGLKHEVLNAKYHQREAEIVAMAGQKGAITIATNMAGRGTDIKLGAGTSTCEVCTRLQQEGIPSQTMQTVGRRASELKELQCVGDPPCGLQIIGTERHESRRIDRQLRGRAGRQGDAGGSIFYLSLEDDLMRLFGSDRIAGLMDKMGAEEGEVIEHPWVSRSIEGAQKRIELQNFQSRKRLLEYDDVMNQQREVVYSLRLFALEGGEELKAEAIRMIDGAVEKPVKEITGVSRHAEEWDLPLLHEQLQMRYLVSVPSLTSETPRSADDVLAQVRVQAREAFQRKVAALDEYGKNIKMVDQAGREVPVGNLAEQVLSQIMLGVLDEKWKDHLYDLDQLRNAITYRAWGQKDPLVEYKQEAYSMFVDLMADLRGTFGERFFKVQVTAGPPAPPPQRPVPRTFSGPAAPGEAPAPKPRPSHSAGMVSEDAMVGSAAGPRAGGFSGPPVPRSPSPSGLPSGWEKTGRNDPCPCGSGKKFKKCHGANLS